MTWLVGIDEAGYGPNLGPLVQAAVAISVDDPAACLWANHSEFVCRATDDAHGRIVVDDSKLVHVGVNKFDKLRENLERVLNGIPAVKDVAIGDSMADLHAEAWYGSAKAGSASDRGNDSLKSKISSVACAPGFPVAWKRACITPTPRFNQLIDRHGTKAAPLAEGVIQLLQTAVAELPNDPISIVIDKQGGRNFYSPMISSAFPEGWVRVLGEAGDCSMYEVEGMGRQIRLMFRPKAERHCLPVAVASMLAKYVRELLMQQFNAYWIEQVPGLTPTAGYPTDAKRFYAAIQPAMERLQLTTDQVWRKK